MSLNGLVYIDGANAMGKTFLAKKFKEKFPSCKIIHCTYRFKKAMWQFHLAAFRRALRFAETGLAIVDRNWISEEIYAHYYRDTTSWPHQGRIMQKLFLKHAAVTVLCNGNINRAVEQVQKHRNAATYHSPEFLTKPREIAGRYESLYYGNTMTMSRNTYVDDLIARGGFGKRFDCLSYNIDIEGKDIDTFILQVAETLDFHRSTQFYRALPFNNRNIAGHLRTAKWVFVGDSVNHESYMKCWPFMAYANSTLFMAQVMHELNLPEEEFMWTNAACPEAHCAALYSIKPELRFVALGAVASAHLRHCGIPHRAIPHPSYGRRFMGKEKWSLELCGALQP